MLGVLFKVLALVDFFAGIVFAGAFLVGADLFGELLAAATFLVFFFAGMVIFLSVSMVNIKEIASE